MKETILYIIRHGEVHNPKGILYGRLPRFPLSTRGRLSIEKAAEQLQKEGIDELYASPMLRARQTALILGEKLDLIPHISKLLIEVKIIFQGISVDEYHKNIQYKLYDPEHIKKGQEDVSMIASRMNKFARYIVNKYPGKRILAVSHGDPILIFKAGILGIPFTWDYKRSHYLKTGEWIKTEFKNGRWKVE